MAHRLDRYARTLQRRGNDHRVTGHGVPSGRKAFEPQRSRLAGYLNGFGATLGNNSLMGGGLGSRGGTRSQGHVGHDGTGGDCARSLQD